ncbi:hypothetical protein CcaCcLH18_08140 [Colletotrichum camelliae]|nr:hypothetical protein CcaCcLH18_08140 [Colletotrichum camelliae]
MATTKMAAAKTAPTTTFTELRVKTRGASKVITVESQETIGQLKQKLFELTQIPVKSQSLASPGFKDNDDSRTVSEVFQNKTSLHVEEAQAHPGSNKEDEEEHRYEDTTADNSNVQQGYLVDNRFHGPDPENRASHDYKVTDVKDGKLRQGDHYIASKQSAISAKDNVQQPGGQKAKSNDHAQQGKTYVEDQHHRSNSPPVKNSGNRYFNTAATKTDQHQGDKIYSDSSGFVPRGAKGGIFNNTKTKGGTLHQGNSYGSE